MKKGIHPKYVQANVVCACGSTFKAGSTRPQLKVEICSQCHPFYTGEQRIVDTAGQVERFMRRMSKVRQGAESQPEQKGESAPAGEGK